MDREIHGRYLEYLERFAYFGRDGRQRLRPDEFEALERERRRLSAVSAPTAAESALLDELSRELLRD